MDRDHPAIFSIVLSVAVFSVAVFSAVVAVITSLLVSDSNPYFRTGDNLINYNITNRVYFFCESFSVFIIHTTTPETILTIVTINTTTTHHPPPPSLPHSRNRNSCFKKLEPLMVAALVEV